MSETPPRNRVVLEGEWDLSRREELAALLESLAPDAPATIDLRGVTFADSTVLAALATLIMRFQATPITLVGPQPQLLRVLKVTHLDSLFKIVDSSESH